jgi:hypothetical protein
MPRAETTHAELSGNRVRFTRLPIDASMDPDSRLLLELWTRKRGTRRAPARAEFDPPELKSVLSKLILMEVRHDPLDFLYRLSGTEIYDIHGMELTGKSVRELTPKPYGEAVWRDMAELVETWEPQYVQLEFVNRQDQSRSYLVLRLPLSSDGERIDRMFVLSVFGADRFKLKELLEQIRS